MSLFGSIRRTPFPNTLVGFAAAAAAFGYAAITQQASAQSYPLADNETGHGHVVGTNQRVSATKYLGQEIIWVYNGKQWQNASGSNLAIAWDQVAPNSRAANLSNGGNLQVTYNSGRITATAPAAATIAPPVKYDQTIKLTTKQLNDNELARLAAGQPASAPVNPAPAAAPVPAPQPERSTHPAAVSLLPPAAQTPATVAAPPVAATPQATTPAQANAEPAPPAQTPVVQSASVAPADTASVVARGTMYTDNGQPTAKPVAFTVFRDQILAWTYNEAGQAVRLTGAFKAKFDEATITSQKFFGLLKVAIRQNDYIQIVRYNVDNGRFSGPNGQDLTYADVVRLQKQAVQDPAAAQAILNASHPTPTELSQMPARKNPGFLGAGILGLPFVRRRQGWLAKQVTRLWRAFNLSGNKITTPVITTSAPHSPKSTPVAAQPKATQAHRGHDEIRTIFGMHAHRALVDQLSTPDGITHTRKNQTIRMAARDGALHISETFGGSTKETRRVAITPSKNGFTVQAQIRNGKTWKSVKARLTEKGTLAGAEAKLIAPLLHLAETTLGKANKDAQTATPLRFASAPQLAATTIQVNAQAAEDQLFTPDGITHTRKNQTIQVTMRDGVLHVAEKFGKAAQETRQMDITQLKNGFVIHAQIRNGKAWKPVEARITEKGTLVGAEARLIAPLLRLTEIALGDTDRQTKLMPLRSAFAPRPGAPAVPAMAA